MRIFYFIGCGAGSPSLKLRTTESPQKQKEALWPPLVIMCCGAGNRTQPRRL